MKKIYSTLVLTCFCFIAHINAQQPEAALGWELGAQAYTFNHFTFFEAVDKTKESGMRFIEAFPGQTIGGGIEGKMDFHMPAEKRKLILKKLKKKGVKLAAFGVVGADSEKEWRALFEFAKAMSIETITSDPNPEDLKFISGLCDKYKINLAIHNHPEPSRYWDPEIVLGAIKGLSSRVGACADVGHWVRSGLDPIESLKKLKGHIISLHFKDINAKNKEAHDVPWGTGISNINGMMAELQDQGFKGLFSVEYEYKWDNNVPDIIESVKYFRGQLKDVGQK